jgi:DNA-binding NarL/FixJ family response regulator
MLEYARMPGKRVASKAVPVDRTALIRRLRTLTPAQSEVARLICLGLSNRSISGKRGSSVYTVARQIVDVLGKLRVGSRQVLAAWYWRELARGLCQTLNTLGLTGPRKAANAALSKSLAVSWCQFRPGQRKLLELQARGDSRAAIARKLGRPSSTVSGTVQSARRLLEFDSALRGIQTDMAAPLASVVTSPAKIIATKEARE